MMKSFKVLLIFPVLVGVQLVTSCSQISLKPSGEITGDKLVKLAKPTVVRIIDGCQAEYIFNPPGYSIVYGKDEISAGRSGSGYFINPDGYIVTNAHVIQSAIENKQSPDKAKKNCEDKLFKQLVARIAMDRGYARDLTTESKIDDWIKDNSLKVDFFRSYSRLRSDIEFVSKVILPGKDAELLTFQVRSHGTVNDKFEGADVAVIKVETRNAPTLMLGNSDNVKYGEAVTTFGYPAAADFQFGLKTESTRQVTVTPATVSNPGKRQKDNAPLLQLNLAGEKGRSGGPILNQKGEVIGMVTYRGVNPDNEGSDTSVSFATPVSTIKQFIGVAGTTNQQGEVQEWYQQGLDYYYRGDLRPAKELFERVKANYPDHSEINDLIVKSQEPGSDPAYLRYLPWIVILSLLIGLAVPTIAFFLLRRRTRLRQVSASAVSASMPNIKAPLTDMQMSNNGHVSFVKTQPFIELNYQGQVLQFDLGKDTYNLGRDADWSDFDVPESWDSLSRHHAILRREGLDYRIYDGDGETPSKYGIHYNNTRIHPKDGYLLRSGAQLKIGSIRGNPILLSYFNPTSARPAPAPTRVVDE